MNKKRIIATGLVFATATSSLSGVAFAQENSPTTVNSDNTTQDESQKNFKINYIKIKDSLWDYSPEFMSNYDRIGMDFELDFTGSSFKSGEEVKLDVSEGYYPLFEGKLMSNKGVSFGYLEPDGENGLKFTFTSDVKDPIIKANIKFLFNPNPSEYDPEKQYPFNIYYNGQGFEYEEGEEISTTFEKPGYFGTSEGRVPEYYKGSPSAFIIKSVFSGEKYNVGEKIKMTPVFKYYVFDDVEDKFGDAEFTIAARDLYGEESNLPYLNKINDSIIDEDYLKNILYYHDIEENQVPLDQFKKMENVDVEILEKNSDSVKFKVKNMPIDKAVMLKIDENFVLPNKKPTILQRYSDQKFMIQSVIDGKTEEIQMFSEKRKGSSDEYNFNYMRLKGEVEGDVIPTNKTSTKEVDEVVTSTIPTVVKESETREGENTSATVTTTSLDKITKKNIKKDTELDKTKVVDEGDVVQNTVVQDNREIVENSSSGGSVVTVMNEEVTTIRENDNSVPQNIKSVPQNRDNSTLGPKIDTGGSVKENFLVKIIKKVIGENK